MRRRPVPPGDWRWTPRQVLLGACFAIIGLLSWWVAQTARDTTSERAVRPRLPDYVVRHFTALETDRSGRPSRRLQAEALRHFTGEDLSELDRPRLEIFQTEGPSWRARAAEGLVLASGDQIRLLGDVEVDREGEGATPPARLESQELDIWRRQSLAETDLPVRIQSDGDTLTANGMRLWYSEPNRTTFHGRAHVRLAPEQEPSNE